MNSACISTACFLAPAVTLAFILTASAADQPVLGYDDTPQLPGQKWRVHDIARPVPRVVTPGTTFSHGAPAPSDATVLFDGKDLSLWASDKGAAGWKVENGYMEVVKETGNIRTREEFGDFQLHLEWASPAEVKGASQGRGNSGVFLHGRFEVQVLDAFNNPTYADGLPGGLYGQWPPLVNAAKPPGEWQSYDIIFEGPRWDADGKLTRAATATVIHNGIVVQHKKELLGPTKHRTMPKYDPYPSKGPIVLQDHGNPVRFRNIWIRPLGEYDKP